MTQSQSIIFTVLPNGIENDLARLTVFLTPNLATDAGDVLSAFPAFERWPETIQKLKFDLFARTGPGEPMKSIALKLTQSLANQDAWTSAFPGSLAVGDSAAKESLAFAAAVPAAYDVVGVRDAIDKLYAAQFGSSDTFSLSARSDLLQGIQRYQPDELVGAGTPSTAILSNAQGAARRTAAFKGFQAFHLAPDFVSSFSVDEETEFHSLVAAASHHWHLLRLFGLALDFVVPAESIDIGDHQLAVVAVGEGPVFGAIETKVLSPWTSYRAAALPSGERLFRARHIDNSATGLLDLGDPKFQFAMQDLDVGAFGAIDYVERIDAVTRMDAPGAIDVSLPARFSKGIQLFNINTAQEIEQAERRTKELATLGAAAATSFERANDGLSGAPVLFQSDLVRGYRVDVWDNGSQKWRSLCMQRTVFKLQGNDEPAREEGFVTDSLSRANEAIGTDRKTSQALFRWHGWSLSAPRPGAAVDESGKTTRDIGSGSILADVPRAEPGSISRLRFKRTYRFRCREVDLAANSWEIADPAMIALASAGEESHPEIQFLRYEPLHVPFFAGREDETSTHLVVGNAPNLRSSVRLSIQAPIGDFARMEFHGAFDRISPRQSYSIITRMDPRSDRDCPVDPAYGGIVARQAWPETASDVVSVEVRPGLIRSEVPSIELRASTGPYLLKKSGRSVICQVPPGGAMKIEVGCLISPRALSAFQTHGASVVPGTAPYSLVAPTRELLVIHPVEKPLEAPSFGVEEPDVPLVTVVPRQLGTTFAMFNDPQFTLHTETTGRFHVLGSWDEASEVPNGDSWPSLTRQSANLFDAEVDLPAGHPLATTEALKRMKGKPAVEKLAQELLTPAVATYDFKDTRFREVEMTAVATSRFADMFPIDPQGDRDRFNRASKPVKVVVPNTKPPAPPEVAYIVPTVGRHESAALRGERQVLTEGWGMRVYVRPQGFLDTGKGVKLAVVFSQPPLQGRLSQIAGDPIVSAHAVVNDLTPRDFVGAKLEYEHLAQIREGNVEAKALQTEDRVSFDYVTASAYEVQYDSAKGMLFADVVLKRRQAYRPFVRLALAKLQPNSVKGAHISPVVFADFIQLTPERTISVTRARQGVHLRVAGSFPLTTSNGPRTELLAIVEQNRSYADNLVWEETSRMEFRLVLEGGENGQSIWVCDLPRYFSSRRTRVTIEEWEVWPGRGQAGRRLVYAEAISLQD